MSAKIKKNVIYFTSIALVLCLCIMDVFSLSSMLPEKLVNTSDELSEIYTNDLSVDNVPEDVSLNIGFDKSNATKIESTDDDNPNVFTVVNDDGTKSLYSFQQPVKFKDKKTKKVKFIDNSMKKSNKSNGLFKKFGFENSDNDIKVYLPKKINEGILVDAEESAVNISPITAVNSEGVQKEHEFLYQKENAVEYPNAFGEGIHLQYASISTGLKENILIEKYDGNNTFEFEIKAKGLIPDCTEGPAINFLDEETKEPVWSIGQPYAKDSFMGEIVNNEVHLAIDNSYTIEETGKNRYLLTMIIDKEFLENPATVYPVLIDPTTQVISQGSFEDTSVFSNNQSNLHSGQWLTVGDLSNYGTGKSYIKIKSLLTYRFINPNNIQSATFNTFEGSGNSNRSVIDLYSSNKNLTTNTLKYGDLSGTWNSSVPTTTSGKWYQFNIKNLMCTWLKKELKQAGGKSKLFGVYLQASNDSALYKHFSSNENSRYATYFRINYVEDTPVPDGDYYIYSHVNANNNRLYLDCTSYDDLIQYPLHGDSNQKLQIEYIVGGYYKFHPKNNSGKSISVSTDLKDLYIADNSNSNSQLFRIVSNDDGTYRIMSVYYNLSKSEALQVTDGSTSAGAKIIQNSYNGSDHQKWVIQKASKGNFYLDAMRDEDGANREEWIIPSKPYLYEMNPSSVLTNYNSNKYDAISRLEKSTLYLIRTHGSQTAVKYTDSDGTVSRMYTSDINSLSSYALKNCRLVLYVACYCGEGSEGATNIVNATFNKGANTVVGFRESIYTYPANYWTERCLYYLSIGSTIDDAGKNAFEDVRKKYGNYMGLDSMYVAGSKTQRLNNFK